MRSILCDKKKITIIFECDNSIEQYFYTKRQKKIIRIYFLKIDFNDRHSLKTNKMEIEEKPTNNQTNYPLETNG